MQRFPGRPAHTLRGGGSQQIKRRQRPGAITQIKRGLLRWPTRGFGSFALTNGRGFTRRCRFRADRHGLSRCIGGAQHWPQRNFRFLAAKQPPGAGLEARGQAGEDTGLFWLRFLMRAQPFGAMPRRFQGGLAGPQSRTPRAAPFAKGQAAADKASADRAEHNASFRQQRAIGAEAARKPGNHPIRQKRANRPASTSQAWCLSGQGGKAQRRRAKRQGKGQAQQPKGNEAKPALGCQPKGPGEQRQHRQRCRITKALQQNI